MQSPELTVTAVLVSGLLIFVGLMKWVVSFMQGYEKRRLELLSKYEATLTENVTLKGQLEVNQFKLDEREKAGKYYLREYQKYKNLYEKSIDTKTKTE